MQRRQGVARDLALVVPVLPGPAGIAPASRRRPPTRSGPRRALGSCGNAALCRTLLSYGTRWRAASPMRARKLHWKSRRDELRLFLAAGFVSGHPDRRRRRKCPCEIDDASSPRVHAEPLAMPPARGECGTARAPEDGGVCERATSRLLEPTHQLTNSPTHRSSVLRRRRDEAAGAPSNGSRVDPLPIAPCR